MAEAAIGIGTNLGDRQGTILQAVNRLESLPDTAVLAVSSLYETEPVGYDDQPWFINAAAIVVTMLSPRKLLDKLLAIEHEFGRERTIQDGPRTLDLDLLLYEQSVIGEPDLIVPHPRLHMRRFVLEPLNEIAPAMTHPLAGKTIAQLHAACTDTATVRRLTQLQSPTQGETSR